MGSGSNFQEIGGLSFNPFNYFMDGDVLVLRPRQAVSSHLELLERWDTSHGWESQFTDPISAGQPGRARSLQGRSLRAAQGGMAGLVLPPFRYPQKPVGLGNYSQGVVLYEPLFLGLVLWGHI